MNKNVHEKSVVSISEMARMVGLSRSRFYQLQGTAFPLPVYDVATRRPFYVEDQQAVCLEVRRQNCGIDRKPILFYAQRSTPSVTAHRSRKSKQSSSKPAGSFTAILDGVKTLGFGTVTEHQVEQAVRDQFPAGTADVEQSEVIRAVFVSMMRQNRGDNVGR